MLRPVHPRHPAEMFDARSILPEQALAAPDIDERLPFGVGQSAVGGNLLTFVIFPFYDAAQFRRRS